MVHDPFPGPITRASGPVERPVTMKWLRQIVGLDHTKTNAQSFAVNCAVPLTMNSIERCSKCLWSVLLFLNVACSGVCLGVYILFFQRGPKHLPKVWKMMFRKPFILLLFEQGKLKIVTQPWNSVNKLRHDCLYLLVRSINSATLGHELCNSTLLYRDTTQGSFDGPPPARSAAESAGKCILPVVFSDRLHS